MAIMRKKTKVKDDKKIKAVIENIKILTHNIPESSDMSHQALLQCRDELRNLIDLLNDRLKKSKSLLPQ
jgi:hypothetical protein